MKGYKSLIVGVLLLVCALGQTNFNSTCQSDSMIDLLATGQIHLNPIDIGNSANKDYYQDLSTAKFQSIDVLGYAFALNGFQTLCDQSYYTLVIDKVEFQNQNTRMRIVVDFRNPADSVITSWTLVSFSYIVVSRNLNGAYSDIWATVAERFISADYIGSIDGTGFTFGVNPSTECSIYKDPHFNFNDNGLLCQSNVPINAAVSGGELVIHAYIMGFRWNSARSTTEYLAVSVVNAQSVFSSPKGIDDEITWTINFAANPSGPSVNIESWTNALEYIKVGFVYSRFDKNFISTYTPTGKQEYSGNYYNPTTSYSQHLFSASYIYQQVTKFNQAVNLEQKSSNSDYNTHYYKLPDARYSIFGLSQF